VGLQTSPVVRWRPTLGLSQITYAEAPAPLPAWRYVNFGTNASNEVRGRRLR